MEFFERLIETFGRRVSAFVREIGYKHSVGSNSFSRFRQPPDANVFGKRIPGQSRKNPRNAVFAVVRNPRKFVIIDLPEKVVFKIPYHRF